MIQITRINKHSLVLNSDLIEQIETTPDTIIHLTTGQKLVVLESAEEIVRRVMEFRRQLLHRAPLVPPPARRESETR
jgi:flagellar protein FlbD